MKVLAATESWTLVPALLRGFFLILAALLEAWILFTLRQLLWDRYDFHHADVIIPVLACAGVVLEILNQLAEAAVVLSPGREGQIIAARILFVIIPWGVIIIIFAAALFKLPFSEKACCGPMST